MDKEKLGGCILGVVGIILMGTYAHEIIKPERYFNRYECLQSNQQNVLGNEKPETYVEVNGVKYYSHIDGKDLNKDISDLVEE